MRFVQGPANTRQAEVDARRRVRVARDLHVHIAVLALAVGRVERELLARADVLALVVRGIARHLHVHVAVLALAVGRVERELLA